MAVGIAAAKRSTPPPLNRIALPAQVQHVAPIVPVAHKVPSYVLGRGDPSMTEGWTHDSERHGLLAEGLDDTDTDTDTDPVELEAVPVEDRTLLSANHGTDVSRSSVTAPPAPPRAEVDPEPRAPDDPRDFELPSHPLRTEP